MSGRVFYNLSIFIISLIFIFFTLNYFYPLETSKIYKPQSKIILNDEKKIIRMIISRDGFWRFRVKFNELTNNLKNSLIYFEDRYFYYHFGVNIFSIIRAIFHNLVNSNKIGASTITMQIARMIEPKERTIKNKLIEIFRAFQLEYNFSKNELIEIYFNLAPYGGNLEGVKSASYFYFNRDIANLSTLEIALLSIIPKNPNINRIDKNFNLKSKAKRVLDLLLKANIISKNSYNRAIREKIINKKFSAIFRHKHFSSLDIFDKNHNINSTLNSELQNYIEKLLYERVEKLKDKNINNGAIIVIDNKNMEIKAYIGSKDFDDLSEGQNDGVLMKRSVGSTLKPFIYALSLDKGLITPKKKILDIPLNFAGFTPINFDKFYRGVITSEEALKLSLNTPFIDLNLRLKKNSLYEMLKSLNIVNRDKNYYGTSIVLGGFGMSLLELTYIYTTLSNSGILKPLKISKNIDIFDFNKTLFSKEASFITSQILANGYRSEFSEYFDSTNNPKIAFKTGTSANARDLLTVGYNNKYTIGLWLGNFDNSPTSEVTGSEIASPIIFEIFNYLSKRENFNWFKELKIKEKIICQDPFISIDSKFCIEKTNDYYLNEFKDDCKNLNAQKINYLSEYGYFNSIKKCFKNLRDKKPLITKPHHKSNIILSKSIPKEFQKLELKCFSYQLKPIIYWYINNSFFKQSDSSESTFKSFKQGEYEIGCLDSNSNYSSVKILVE